MNISLIPFPIDTKTGHSTFDRHKWESGGTIRYVDE